MAQLAVLRLSMVKLRLVSYLLLCVCVRARARGVWFGIIDNDASQCIVVVGGHM